MDLGKLLPSWTNIVIYCSRRSAAQGHAMPASNGSASSRVTAGTSGTMVVLPVADVIAAGLLRLQKRSTTLPVKTYRQPVADTSCCSLHHGPKYLPELTIPSGPQLHH